MLVDEDVLDRPETLLARLRPDILVCCASAQSPYERTTRPSAWTALVQRSGFGLTLALQASVVARLARAITSVSPGTRLVNACFPDAVNPVLAAVGLPIWFGIGNVATLASCLQAGLDLPNQDSLAVLGHHVHLNPAAEPADEIRAWLDGQPIQGLTRLLSAARALPRADLNGIGGRAAARLLVDLLDGVDVRTNVPGPLGLPGGYPVTVSADRAAPIAVELALPDGCEPADAIAWNRRVGRHDGIDIQDGYVTHEPSIVNALATLAPDIASGWPAHELDEVYRIVLDLRHRLRLTQPASVRT